MTQLNNKSDILVGLQESYVAITKTTRRLSSTDFLHRTDNRWSPADYLKHLILSVKPFASALQLPHNQLETMFGKSTRESMTYTDLVDVYDAKLAEGLRAEDNPAFTPVTYKLPDNVDDSLRDHLADVWQLANNRLIAALNHWSEDNLDTYVLPHPALSQITIREMCFFTIYHNKIHLKDFQ